MRLILFLAIFTCLQSFAGSYDPRFIWPKNNVVVCFLDDLEQVEKTMYSADPAKYAAQDFEPEFFDLEQRNNIEALVTKEFTPDLTGIHFTGWLGCSQTPETDIIIIKAGDYNQGAFFGLFESDPTSFRGETLLGRGYTQAEIDQGLNKKTPTIVMEDDPKDYTITHEFSHAASLVHEHPRKAFREDQNCKVFVGLNDIRWTYEGNERHNSFIEFFGEYDAMSITNYCSKNRRVEFRNTNGELSPQDRATLKFIYP